MPRKPAILLVSLLLLLSIGGAVFHHHLRKLEPAFSEVDSFLRTSAATGDWEYDTRSAKHYTVKSRWWGRLGIPYYTNYEQLDYLFLNTLTTEVVLVSVWLENGKLVKYHYSGSSVPAQTLKDAILRRFPPLRHPRYQP